MIVNRRQLLVLHRDHTTRLVKVQDDERKVLAAEVHDEIAQRLGGVRNGLIAFRDLTPLEPGADAVLDALEKELAALRAAMRVLSQRLHPTRVDQAGLRVALQGLVQELKQEYHDAVRIHLDLGDVALPDRERGWAIFRIVQEAVRNALRHGGVAEVQVSIVEAQDQLVVKISDQGRGFDSTATGPARRSGLGLVIMNERATLAGGSLALQSFPGEGTVVRAVFPLREEPADG